MHLMFCRVTPEMYRLTIHSPRACLPPEMYRITIHLLRFRNFGQIGGYHPAQGYRL
jgi:hypothetical protein